MNVKTAKKKLYHLAMLEKKAAQLHRELEEEMELENGYDLCDNPLCGLDTWEISDILTDCKVENGVLYNADGKLLSRDGRCMKDPFGYFVNQSVGYCEDDFYGTMFVDVDGKGTFVKIHYSC